MKGSPGKLTWTQEAIEAFEILKSAMCNSSVLTRVDYNKTCTVITDASKEGLGLVLAQHDDEGREHVILYDSRATK